MNMKRILLTTSLLACLLGVIPVAAPLSLQLLGDAPAANTNSPVDTHRVATTLPLAHLEDDGKTIVPGAATNMLLGFGMLLVGGARLRRRKLGLTSPWDSGQPTTAPDH